MKNITDKSSSKSKFFILKHDKLVMDKCLGQECVEFKSLSTKDKREYFFHYASKGYESAMLVMPTIKKKHQVQQAM